MRGTKTFLCDLCGSDAPEEIPCAMHYTCGQPLHVCKACGFVYVRKRRTGEEVAKDWSDNKFGDHDYTANLPAIKARQVFVAEMINTSLGISGKSVCDIGSGEGQFLEIIRGPEYHAEVFAIEPSDVNCKRMRDRGISNFSGTIENYVSSQAYSAKKFDLITMLWTLECTQDPRSMLRAAFDLLNPEGHVVIATGSRILVPFKKPLNYYLGNTSSDSNCSRFSVNTLCGILAVSGFVVEHQNRYIDHDVLCVIGKKTEGKIIIQWEKDDYREVLDFFDRWHIETQNYYSKN